MAAIPLVPAGYATVPAVYCAYECLKFASDVQKEGLEATIKKESIQTSLKFFVPSISNGLWNLTASKLGAEFTNTPFGKLAEVAFKKTINTILTQGIQAFEEQATGNSAEQNIKQFTDKFGQDGFLRVYFSKYLYEIADYYLHSKGTNPEEDSGFLYYFGSNQKLFSPQELDDFRKNLRIACKDKSTNIVERIKQRDVLLQLRKVVASPDTARELADVIDEVLQELAREGAQ